MTKSNLKGKSSSVDGAAAGVGAAGAAHHNNQNKHHNEEKFNQNNQYNDQSEGKKGGFMKTLRPLIAAILIPGNSNIRWYGSK